MTLPDLYLFESPSVLALNEGQKRRVWESFQRPPLRLKPQRGWDPFAEGDVVTWRDCAQCGTPFHRSTAYMRLTFCSLMCEGEYARRHGIPTMWELLHAARDPQWADHKRLREWSESNGGPLDA